MTKISRASVLSLSMVALSFLLTVLLYARLPAAMPIHWNLAGEVDNTMAKPLGPFLLPLINLATLAGLLMLPRVSPKSFSIESFRASYDTIMLALMAFLTGVHTLTLGAALGYDLDIGRLVCLGCGALFLVIGNVMGKLTPNFFVGIRTPWTLADQEVWYRTHRLGGKLFVLAGLGTMLSAFFGSVLLMLGLLLTASFVPVLYSYLEYRKLNAE